MNHWTPVLAQGKCRKPAVRRGAASTYPAENRAAAFSTTTRGSAVTINRWLYADSPKIGASTFLDKSDLSLARDTQRCIRGYLNPPPDVETAQNC